MTRDELELAKYFGEARTNISIVSYPPHGEDSPDDMATAWLNGDMQRYETLVTDYQRRNPGYSPPTIKPRRSRGGQRRLDWAAVHSMRAKGANLRTIAETFGCGTTQIWRVLQRSDIGQTMLD